MSDGKVELLLVVRHEGTRVFAGAAEGEAVPKSSGSPPAPPASPSRMPSMSGLLCLIPTQPFASRGGFGVRLRLAIKGETPRHAD